MRFLLLLLLFVNTNILAQESTENDSLVEMWKFIKKNHLSNPSAAKLKTKEFLHLSKIKKKYDYVFLAYLELASLGIVQGEFTKTIEYTKLAEKIVDSLNPKHRDNYLYILESRKGASFLKLGDDHTAIEHYLTAVKYAKKTGVTKLLIEAQNNIGIIKLNIGFKEEALDLFKENIKLCIEHKIDKDYIGVINYTGVVRSFLALRQPDSALVYATTALKYASRNNDVEGESYFFLDMGTAYFMKGEFKKAIDYLKRAEKVTLDLNNKKRIVDIYYYIGKSYAGLKDYKNSLHFLEKAKETIVEENVKSKDSLKFSPHILLKTYETLADIYKEQGNLQASNTNYEEYKKLDKEKDNNRTTVYETLLDNVTKEKKELASSESNLKERFHITIWITCIILISFLFFIWKYLNIRKKNKRIFEQLMKNEKQEKKPIDRTENIKSTNDIGVPEKIIQELLKKLKDFEMKQGYLKPISITSLAKKLKTNPKYLSKVINGHFQKNFSTYINTMRINYAVEQLKSDSNFKKYTIKAIANEVGFKNTESFSKAFLKNTGISPSYFIKQLQKL